jgi:hypothetical protein
MNPEAPKVLDVPARHAAADTIVYGNTRRNVVVIIST